MFSLKEKFRKFSHTTEHWLILIFCFVIYGSKVSYGTSDWAIYLISASVCTAIWLFFYFKDCLSYKIWLIVFFSYSALLCFFYFAKTLSVIVTPFPAYAKLVLVMLIFLTLLTQNKISRRDKPLRNFIFWLITIGASILLSSSTVGLVEPQIWNLTIPLYLSFIIVGIYFLFNIKKAIPIRIYQSWLKFLILIILIAVFILLAGMIIFSVPKIISIVNVLLSVLFIVVLGNWSRNFCSDFRNNSKQPKLFVTVLILSVIIGLAIGLRLYHCDLSPPYIDEYFHLLTAKYLAGHDNYLAQYLGGDFIYARSFALVTVPVFVSFKFFGVSFWSGQFPGILINSLAILPLFLILKRINYTTGFVGAFLFAVNPWMIVLSRTVREYAYLPLIFSLITLGLIMIMDKLPSKIRIARDWKIFMNFRGILLLSLLFLPIIVMVIDNKSTLITGALIYLVAVVVLLFRLDWQSRFNLVFVFILALLFIFSLWLIKSDNLSLLPKFNPFWLKLFLVSSQKQWYYDLPFITPVMAGVAILFYWIITKCRYTFFILLCFFLNAYFFSFHFSRYTKPRYFSSTETWYTLIIAIGLCLVYTLIAKNLPNKVAYKSLLFATLVIAFINFAQIAQPVFTITRAGNDPISNDFRDYYNNVSAYIKSKKNDREVLVSSLGFDFFNKFNDEKYFDAVHYFRSKEFDKKEKALSFIDSHPNGWVVIDSRYLGEEFPQEDFSTTNTQINYVGQMDQISIYEWGHKW